MIARNTDPAEIIRTLVASLGVNAAELHAIAAGLAGPELPTMGDYLPTVIERCSAKTLPSYGVHFRRMVDRLGDRRIDEVTAFDLEAIRDDIRERAAAAKLARADRTGRPLRSSDPDAYGHGAAENFVRAARFFFRTATKQGLLHRNPALDVAVPKRPPAPERPLTEDELAEFAFVVSTTGNDPELDTNPFEFHRKTAARREGGQNLRLCDLDERRCSVTLTEKNGKTRELPLDRDFIRRLKAFAAALSAVGPADKVFRSRKGQPISRRRYEAIYDRLDEHTDWSRILDVGIHWLRHTTLDDVRVVAGTREPPSNPGRFMVVGWQRQFRRSSPASEGGVATTDRRQEPSCPPRATTARWAQHRARVASGRGPCRVQLKSLWNDPPEVPSESDTGRWSHRLPDTLTRVREPWPMGGEARGVDTLLHGSGRSRLAAGCSR